MRVEKLLSLKGRDVTTISASRTVGDAVKLLKERGIGAVIVTDGTGPIAGILSERDVVRALEAHNGETLAKPVSDIMSSPVTTCDENMSVDHLMVVMTENRFRHVPVVHEGKLTGMVSIGDVVKVRLSELENEKKDLLDYVSAW
jgi:CBS domain-containing protein